MKQSQGSSPFISWGQLILILLGFVAFFFILSAVTGCNSEKKIMKGVNKGLVYYPTKTVQAVRALYPCIKIGRSFYADSTAYKNSLDSLAQTKEFFEALLSGLADTSGFILKDPSLDSICNSYLKKIDKLNTIKEYQEKYIIRLTDDFNHIEPVVIHDSVAIEDLSKVMEIDAELQDSKDEAKQVKLELKEANDKKDNWFGWAVKLGLSSLVLFLLVLLLGYLLFKKKKYEPPIIL